MSVPRPKILACVLAIAAFAGCGPVDQETFGPFTENMPGPASVWLTSDPATPDVAVPVVMRSLAEPRLRFSHTFAPGVPMRGAIATSEGRYRLAGLGDACVLDLNLGPSEAVDVLLTLDDAGCALTLTRSGHMEDPAMFHEEPAVLITNQNAGNELPVIEP